MKKLFLSIFICFFLTACDKSKENDFDVVCEIFKNFNKQSENFSEEEMLEISVEKVREKLAENSPARVSWEAITGAPAAERYNLFQSGAEATMKRSWKCPTMKVLLDNSDQPK